MAMTVDQLKDRLTIDKHDLDNELVQQPVLYHEVADQLAAATDRQTKAKDALERAEATIDRHIRASMETDGKKMTETALKAQVATHKDVVEATGDLREAAAEVAALSALREAYAQRSYMVRELCSLFIAGYWQTANTSVKSDVPAEQAATKNNRARLTASRNAGKH